jgi:hypothetical protein
LVDVAPDRGGFLLIPVIVVRRISAGLAPENGLSRFSSPVMEMIKRADKDFANLSEKAMDNQQCPHKR